MNEISVLIADDHPIFRDGLKGIIEKASNLKIAAEAGSGAEALNLIEVHQPHVAVLDLDMPQMDGLEVVAHLKKANAPVKIVILTMHKDEANFRRAFESGVNGYVLKDEAAPEIVRCIEIVAAGGEFFSPLLSAHLAKRFRNPSQNQVEIETLTPSERRVLRALAELKTSRQIAAEFNLSPRTVDNQRAQICQKLNLKGTHALVKFALEHKEKLL
jgi:DNA-binding NarL/FixJ family response regulator